MAELVHICGFAIRTVLGNKLFRIVNDVDDKASVGAVNHTVADADAEPHLNRVDLE